MTADALMAEAAASITRMTPHEVAAAIASGAIVIDTRDVGDRVREGTIDGAIHVPMSVLEWRADPASDDRDDRLLTGAQLIVVCNDGYSSTFSARNLRRLGHSDAADLIGGYRAWKAEGLSTRSQ
jgi:rhodanese-related sulfurtransferase